VGISVLDHGPRVVLDEGSQNVIRFVDEVDDEHLVFARCRATVLPKSNCSKITRALSEKRAT